MTLDIQFKIKNNPNYQRYIRENSYWYKILNRNPYMFKNFEEEVKEKYHLRATDRISRTLDAIEMIQTVVSQLK
ncbi:MAG: hypothetical protein J6K21_02690 [Bacilli bacterium]|nr:hypothetical protein [Bacilli bacterium]